MLKKVLLSLSAIPLVMTFSLSSAEAIGPSADAKVRNEAVCRTLKAKKNRTVDDEKLLSFCDGTTFHCTSHRKGGIFGMVKGVCDAPNLCQDDTLRQACQTHCVDNRRQDDKTKKIKEKLDLCPVNKASIGTSMPTQQPKAPVEEPEVMASPVVEQPPVSQPKVETPSRPRSMRGSVLAPLPRMEGNIRETAPTVPPVLTVPSEQSEVPVVGTENPTRSRSSSVKELPSLRGDTPPRTRQSLSPMTRGDLNKTMEIPALNSESFLDEMRDLDKVQARPSTIPTPPPPPPLPSFFEEGRTESVEGMKGMDEVQAVPSTITTPPPFPRAGIRKQAGPSAPAITKDLPKNDDILGEAMANRRKAFEDDEDEEDDDLMFSSSIRERRESISQVPSRRESIPPAPVVKNPLSSSDSIIRDGVSVHPSGRDKLVSSAPAVMDRGDLLAQIREGKQLRKVEVPIEKKAVEEGSMVGALKKSFDQMNLPHDEGSDDDASEDWN